MLEIYVGSEVIERLNEIEVSTLGEGGIFSIEKESRRTVANETP